MSLTKAEAKKRIRRWFYEERPGSRLDEIDSIIDQIDEREEGERESALYVAARDFLGIHTGYDKRNHIHETELEVLMELVNLIQAETLRAVRDAIFYKDDCGVDTTGNPVWTAARFDKAIKALEAK